VALFCFGIDAKSHHSDHEIARKFIQFSGVIAVMAATRQKWGKNMADPEAGRREAKTVWIGANPGHRYERQVL
jgi:hypothetical protein